MNIWPTCGRVYSYIERCDVYVCERANNCYQTKIWWGTEFEFFAMKKPRGIVFSSCDTINRLLKCREFIYQNNEVNLWLLDRLWTISWDGWILVTRVGLVLVTRIGWIIISRIVLVRISRVILVLISRIGWLLVSSIWRCLVPSEGRDLLRIVRLCLSYSRSFLLNNYLSYFSQDNLRGPKFRKI